MRRKPNEEDENVKEIAVRTEKELNQYFDSFEKTLKDTSADWKVRLASLKQLQGLLLGGNSDMNGFKQRIEDLVPQMVAQADDLRSAIQKEACKCLDIASQVMGDNFEEAAVRLVQWEGLLHLLGNGKKLLADSGHECIEKIITRVPSIRYFGTFVEQLDSKNSNVRAKVASYFAIMAREYPQAIIEKASNTIEQMILKTHKDASQEVRQLSRNVFCSFEEILPKRAEILYQKFDQPTRKLLQKEKETANSSLSSSQQRSLSQVPPSSAKMVKSNTVESKKFNRTHSETPQQQTETKNKTAQVERDGLKSRKPVTEIKVGKGGIPKTGYQARNMVKQGKTTSDVKTNKLMSVGSQGSLTSETQEVSSVEQVKVQEFAHGTTIDKTKEKIFTDNFQIPEVACSDKSSSRSRNNNNSNEISSNSNRDNNTNNNVSNLNEKMKKSNANNANKSANIQSQVQQQQNTTNSFSNSVLLMQSTSLNFKNNIMLGNDSSAPSNQNLNKNQDSVFNKFEDDDLLLEENQDDLNLDAHLGVLQNKIPINGEGKAQRFPSDLHFQKEQLLLPLNLKEKMEAEEEEEDPERPLLDEINEISLENPKFLSQNFLDECSTSLMQHEGRLYSQDPSVAHIFDETTKNNNNNNNNNNHTNNNNNFFSGSQDQFTRSHSVTVGNNQYDHQKVQLKLQQLQLEQQQFQLQEQQAQIQLLLQENLKQKFQKVEEISLIQNEPSNVSSIYNSAMNAKNLKSLKQEGEEHHQQQLTEQLDKSPKSSCTPQTPSNNTLRLLSQAIRNDEGQNKGNCGDLSNKSKTSERRQMLETIKDKLQMDRPEGEENRHQIANHKDMLSSIKFLGQLGGDSVNYSLGSSGFNSARNHQEGQEARGKTMQIQGIEDIASRIGYGSSNNDSNLRIGLPNGLLSEHKQSPTNSNHPLVPKIKLDKIPIQQMQQLLGKEATSNKSSKSSCSSSRFRPSKDSQGGTARRNKEGRNCENIQNQFENNNFKELQLSQGNLINQDVQGKQTAPKYEAQADSLFQSQLVNSNLNMPMNYPPVQEISQRQNPKENVLNDATLKREIVSVESGKQTMKQNTSPQQISSFLSQENSSFNSNLLLTSNKSQKVGTALFSPKKQEQQQLNLHQINAEYESKENQTAQTNTQLRTQSNHLKQTHENTPDYALLLSQISPRQQQPIVTYHHGQKPSAQFGQIPNSDENNKMNNNNLIPSEKSLSLRLDMPQSQNNSSRTSGMTNQFKNRIEQLEMQKGEMSFSYHSQLNTSKRERPHDQEQLSIPNHIQVDQQIKINEGAEHNNTYGVILQPKQNNPSEQKDQSNRSNHHRQSNQQVCPVYSNYLASSNQQPLLLQQENNNSYNNMTAKKENPQPFQVISENRSTNPTNDANNNNSNDKVLANPSLDATKNLIETIVIQKFDTLQREILDSFSKQNDFLKEHVAVTASQFQKLQQAQLSIMSRSSSQQAESFYPVIEKHDNKQGKQNDPLGGMKIEILNHESQNQQLINDLSNVESMNPALKLESFKNINSLILSLKEKGNTKDSSSLKQIETHLNALQSACLSIFTKRDTTIQLKQAAIQLTDSLLDLFPDLCLSFCMRAIPILIRLTDTGRTSSLSEETSTLLSKIIIIYPPSDVISSLLRLSSHNHQSALIVSKTLQLMSESFLKQESNLVNKDIVLAVLKIVKRIILSYEQSQEVECAAFNLLNVMHETAVIDFLRDFKAIIHEEEIVRFRFLACIYAHGLEAQMREHQQDIIFSEADKNRKLSCEFQQTQQRKQHSSENRYSAIDLELDSNDFNAIVQELVASIFAGKHEGLKQLEIIFMKQSNVLKINKESIKRLLTLFIVYDKTSQEYFILQEILKDITASLSQNSLMAIAVIEKLIESPELEYILLKQIKGLIKDTPSFFEENLETICIILKKILQRCQIVETRKEVIKCLVALYFLNPSAIKQHWSLFTVEDQKKIASSIKSSIKHNK